MPKARVRVGPERYRFSPESSVHFGKQYFASKCWHDTTVSHAIMELILMRQKLSCWIGMGLFSLLVAFPATQGYAEPLTDDEFRELHKQLQPDGDELWRTIPWKISLLDAQRSAAKENKPIFIWAMDGHPLGCT